MRGARRHGACSDCRCGAGRAGIALWHVLSGLLDYSILKRIYFSVPELAAKKRRRYECVGGGGGNPLGRASGRREALLPVGVEKRRPSPFFSLSMTMSMLAPMSLCPSPTFPLSLPRQGFYCYCEL